jgi:Spx/MgsR family transcriptional regulator
MITVYGIPNCDTVKKVQTWLTKHKISYSFHDYKKEGAPIEKLQSWVKQRDWTEILNKKSTTWRALDTSAQEKVKDAKSAVQLMHENNSIIKRPVIEKDGRVVAVGFDEAVYKKVFL